MRRPHGLVVLDAGVIIAHLDAAHALHRPAERMLEELASARLAASVLTVAECLVRPSARGSAALAARALERLELERVPLAGEAAEALAAVRAETGLRMPDAIVVCTAEMLGAAVATTDRAVASAALGRGVEVHQPMAD